MITFRNSSHTTRHDYDTPPSTRRSGGELGGRPGFPPPPKFSGAPIPESELLEDQPKKKFTGRCRLFVGNLSTEFKEQDLKELFLPYGEISVYKIAVFYSKKTYSNIYLHLYGFTGMLHFW